MNPNFIKCNGLIPAIVQDSRTNVVLMLGFMDQEAYEKTRQTGTVTFYSRMRRQLWTKGETSGSYLQVQEMRLDCDQDTLLIKATPQGPVCHTGSDTCFNEQNTGNALFLLSLEQIIHSKKTAAPASSYTARLFTEGIPKIAQKIGEEAVETVIEAVQSSDALLKEEAADLLYHLLVLLAAKGITVRDIDETLRERHNKAGSHELRVHFRI